MSKQNVSNPGQLLESIGTVTIPATTVPFVVQDAFVVGNVGIAYVGDQFKTQFFGKTEEPIAETTLRYAKLTNYSVGSSILKELGDKAETTLAQIHALIERQAHGEEGVLIINGMVNIFCVSDVNGEPWAVFVLRGRGGWYVLAFSVTYPFEWDDESRVFSRNS